MTLTLTRNGKLLPSLSTDMFDEDFFTVPDLFDGDSFSSGLRRNIPSVNIIENTDNFKIELAVPGMEKKDLKAEVDKGVLTISAEKEEEEKEESKNYTRKEFSYTAFSRSFKLPENCIPEKITAGYDNGLLTLTLPKQEVTVSKPKKQIKVS